MRRIKKTSKPYKICFHGTNKRMISENQPGKQNGKVCGHDDSLDTHYYAVCKNVCKRAIGNASAT